jgi:DNA-binding MarR family transcriptional regulator
MPDLSVEQTSRRRELNLALEALHFAFRAVIEGPDDALAKRDLSRVHHRILYFIAKTPGLRVNELRATLGVTKQAMNVPLRELTERGFVSETVDDADRRGKHLHLTARGRDLEERLSGEQRERFAHVFRKVGKDKEQAWHEVMHLLVEPIAAPRVSSVDRRRAR